MWYKLLKEKKGISSTIYWYIHFQLNGYIKSYILMEKEEFNHESMKVSFGVWIFNTSRSSEK